MELKLLTPIAWKRSSSGLLRFAVRFGDKRLTAASIRALQMLDCSLFETDADGRSGAAAVVARHEGRIVGVGSAVNDGAASCVIAVHPDARGLGIGCAIMQAMIERLGSLACHVAADNTACMALCFRSGLKAVALHTGPTGKPTLRFEGGIEHGTARPWHSHLISQ